MNLTPAVIRFDKPCGKSAIPDHYKCTKSTTTAISRSPNYIKLGLGALAIGGVTLAGLRAVDDLVKTRSRQYGEPTFTTFRDSFGNADYYRNSSRKQRVAAGAFGETSFVEVGGKKYVVKEPKRPAKEARKAMAMGLDNKATRQLYRAQGRVTQSEVANARLAGDIGVAPRVIAADRNSIITEVAQGAPLKDFNTKNKKQLFSTLAKLHRSGIAHNDLKADNIFEDKKSGKLQLIDFGLSMRDSGAVAREWYRAMNPPSPNVLLAVTGTTTGSFNLKKLNPQGYAKAAAALSTVIGGSISEERIIESARDPRKARQMQRVINNFYEGKYNQRVDSSRTDKKCGASGIPDNATCHKGGSWPQAATIGAALTAGGIAAFALTRGGSTKPKAAASPESGPPRLPGLTPRALLKAAPPRQSKTQRMRANTAAAVKNAEAGIAQTAREEVRRIAQIGNTMAAAGEATGMAAKTTLRELRLRTEAARRRFEPGYRAPDQRRLPQGTQPKLTAGDLTPQREAIPIDPRTGQPRRRKARGFGRTDNFIQHYASVQLQPPTRRDACWEGYEQVGMKRKGKRRVPNCVPTNKKAQADTEDGKKYSKTVTNPETGRKNKVRYGAKGYKIAPGTDKGDRYCQRSYGQMKMHKMNCAGPDKNSPLCLSRSKWRCTGKQSQ